MAAEGIGVAGRLARWQETVAQMGFDGWLVADFRWQNPLFARLLGLGGGILTRRCFLWLPRAGDGEPAVFASRVDGHTFAGLDCVVRLYNGYEDMAALLAQQLPHGKRIAMEYVPHGLLPTVSRVDAGLIEVVREMGVEIVSSGPLIAALEVWSERQRALHERAARAVDEARGLALRWCDERLARDEAITEGAVAGVIAAYFAECGLDPGDGPDVAVADHAADPHYRTGGTQGAVVGRDTVLLIDLWARVADDVEAPYADSTWMAYTGATPPSDVVRAFEVTRQARDAVVDALQAALGVGMVLSGADADRAARATIAAAGLTDRIFHRTGHSLGVDHVHGMGTNLDSIEFPDDRPLLPYTGFTIEPGLYWPGRFGVRLEVSAILLPEGLHLTTESQRALTLLAGQA